MTPALPDIRLAVSVALFSGGRFLLVRRGRMPSKGMYAFPGGRVEPGETLEDAARRELMEETGLKVGVLTLHAVLDLDSEQSGFIYRLHVHHATEATGMLAAGDDAEEAGWFSLDEMQALPVTSSTLNVALAIAAHAERG